MSEDGGEKLFKDWLFNRGFRKDIEITKKDFLFFPFWLIRVKTTREIVQDIISPAAFSELNEINKMAFKGGELVSYNQDLVRGKEIRFPATSFRKHLNEVLKKQLDPSLKILEKTLVHLPIMFIQCRYQGMDYTGIIDVSTGEVIVDVFPYKPRTSTAIGFFLTVLFMSLLFSIELKYIQDGFARAGIFLLTGVFFYFIVKAIFVRL